MSIKLARYLDAAILKPETTHDEFQAAMKACLNLEVWSVCVRPCDVEAAQALCAGTNTKVCVVLGFPHGCQLTGSKVDEARRYVDLGVEEIDMVANYGWAKSGLWDALQADIAAVIAVCKPAGVLLKVIFETAQLDQEQIQKLTEICVQLGADFVKTSTGFNGEGAKEQDVKLMLATAAGRCKVKPSGGIREAAHARKLIEMGAERLGVNWSSCQAICSGSEASSSGVY